MIQTGKRWLSLLLALLLCMSIMPGAGALEDGAVNYTVEIVPEQIAARQRVGIAGAAHEAAWYTESAVYDRLMQMRSEYPEGKPWTNDNSYVNTYLWYGGQWSGSYVRYTGYGCAGFVLIMSDAAFGANLPVWQNYNVSFYDIRVGDILRINNDSHSVIVLKVNSASVTVAEGNYNSSIHWGRTLSAMEVEKADYVLTRWPGFPATYTVSYDANGGSGAPASQIRTQNEILALSGERPVRRNQFFLGWAESANASSPTYQPGEAFAKDGNVTLYAVWAEPDLTLPASLRSIGEEAFAGGAFRFVRLSDMVTSVGKNAFADCRNLRYAYIPAATTSIDPDAFGGNTGLTILGHTGSAAASFARANDLKFIAVS